MQWINPRAVSSQVWEWRERERERDPNSIRFLKKKEIVY